MNWILSPLYYLAIISMAVSVISLTVTKTKLFKPMRDKIDSKSKFFGELFSCPYCFSFYPSLLFVIFFFEKLRLTFGPSFQMYGMEMAPFDFLISWFCMVCIASFYTGFIYRSISQIE